MDKKTLEAAAEKLASAELVCRSLYLIAEETRIQLQNHHPKSFFEGKKEQRLLEKACQDANANYERSAAEVAELTRKLNTMRANSEELSAKRYWWDVPFRLQNPEEPDTCCFDGGIYVEQGDLRTEYQGTFSLLKPKIQCLNPTALLNYLSNSRLFTLFLDKKKLRLHINDEMQVKYLYHVICVCGTYAVTSYMNTEEDPAAAIRQAYQESVAARRAEFADDASRLDRQWDERERFRHLSPFTNEERWLMGDMSNEDYLQESLWRSYPVMDKLDRMHRDLDQLRIQALDAQEEARKHFVKSRKDDIHETNLLRVMPVGEVFYCQDDLLAIALYKTPQPVTEYDCAQEVELTELTGRYYSSRKLFRKKPALAPIVRHIAMAYKHVLPDYRVLKPCPQGCPDEIWRVWAEARWAQQILSRKSE